MKRWSKQNNNNKKETQDSCFHTCTQDRNVISTPAPPRITDVHLPKDDEIITGRRHTHTHTLHSGSHTCEVGRSARLQSGSLNARAHTVHRPLSSNSPLLPALIPFHTLSIPKTVVHRNQQQTTGISPHHFTTIVLYYTKKHPHPHPSSSTHTHTHTPFHLAPNTDPPHPSFCLRANSAVAQNMNYKCMANKREEGGKREREEGSERERGGDRERQRDREWLVETSEKMTPLQESIDQFLSKGDVRHEITWQFEH